MRAWRRKSSGVTASSTPTGLQVLTVITNGLGDYNFTFSAPATDTGLSDANLQVHSVATGWRDATSVGQVTPVEIDFTADNGAVDCDLWRCQGQPAAIAEAVNFPQAGSVT